MSAYTTGVLRQLRAYPGRFLSILVITALGVAFFAGLRATGPDMRDTAQDYLSARTFFDIRVLSPGGLTDDDAETLRGMAGVSAVSPAYAADAVGAAGGRSLTVKIHSLPQPDGDAINTPLLLEGRLPETDTECLIDPKFANLTGRGVNDTLTLSAESADPLANLLAQAAYTIVGVAETPLYISVNRGANTVGNGKTDAFVLLPFGAFQTAGVPPYSEIYVTVHNPGGLARFDKKYLDTLDPVETLIEDQGWYALNLETNAGFIGYKQDTERVDSLSLVMPILFFLVAILVTMTSMTRLVDSDRTQIGTYKALGYGNARIALRYLFYAVTSSVIGGVLGLFAGFYGFPQLLAGAYASLYVLPPLKMSFNVPYAVASIAAAALSAAGPAFLVCLRSLSEVPAELLRPAMLPDGKRFFLERIRPLWRRLSFFWKVTLRNLFRYKKRLMMTLIGVAGCTALMFAGFAIRDAISTVTDKQYGEIYRYGAEVDYWRDEPEAYKSALYEILDGNGDIVSHTALFQQPIDLLVGDTRKTALMIAPEDPAAFGGYINLRNRKTGEALTVGGDTAIVTEKIANDLGVKVGDRLELRTNDGKGGSITVGHIAEHYVFHYVYMPPSLYESVFGEDFAANKTLCLLRDGADREAILAEADASPIVSSVAFAEDSVSQFGKTVNAMRIVVWVLIGSSAALICVVLYCLTSINLEERSRELATIKVLGFTDAEMTAYIFRENALMTLTGTALGLALGVALQRYILVTMEVDLLMFSRDILWQSYVFAAGLTLLFAAAVNAAMWRAIRNVDMISSLKSVE